MCHAESVRPAKQVLGSGSAAREIIAPVLRASLPLFFFSPTQGESTDVVFPLRKPVSGAWGP